MEPSGTILGLAKITFELNTHEGTWSVSCVIGKDNIGTIRQHLARYIPGAHLLDVEFIPYEPRVKE